MARCMARQCHGAIYTEIIVDNFVCRTLRRRYFVERAQAPFRKKFQGNMF